MESLKSIAHQPAEILTGFKHSVSTTQTAMAVFRTRNHYAIAIDADATEFTRTRARHTDQQKGPGLNHLLLR